MLLYVVYMEVYIHKLTVEATVIYFNWVSSNKELNPKSSNI